MVWCGPLHLVFPDDIWHMHAPTFNKWHKQQHQQKKKKKKKKKATLHILTHGAMRGCGLPSLMVCINDKICDIRERNVKIRSEILTTNIRSLGFQDIREWGTLWGLKLWSSGCSLGHWVWRSRRLGLANERNINFHIHICSIVCRHNFGRKAYIFARWLMVAFCNGQKWGQFVSSRATTHCVCVTNFIWHLTSNPKCSVTFLKTKMNVNWHLHFSFIVSCDILKNNNECQLKPIFTSRKHGKKEP
jgi:hypothetical protein